MKSCETGDGALIQVPERVRLYRFVRVIGVGANAVVVEMEHFKTKIHYAVKIVSRARMNETGTFEMFERELRIHSMMNHPNIIRIHEVIYQPDQIYVVMDLCEGGDLLSYIVDTNSPYPLGCRRILKEIVEGLIYIHEHKVLHCDIKPENILLTKDYTVKIADFGSSFDLVSKTKNRKMMSGTLLYIAPEVLKDLAKVTTKADMWSLGILAVVLFARILPYPECDTETLKRIILEGKVNIPENVPPDVNIIIKACTKTNPDERISAKQLLAYPFFHEIGVRFNVPKKYLSCDSTPSRCYHRNKRMIKSTSMRSICDPNKETSVRPPIKSLLSFPAITYDQETECVLVHM